jgi:tRNA-uridine 2-sulfurtransferase
MTIAVAMSGGVDSSTAAAILAAEPGAAVGGRTAERDPVIGLTMQLWNQRRLPRLQGLEQSAATPGHASGRCCSLNDVYDARRVANFLSIPYYVVNFERRFEEGVVRPFVEQYLAGGTPIPCSLCNTEIKFEQFVTTALGIGADCIATGHYARLRRDQDTGRFRLFAALDRTKDQSYFLFGLTQEQLARSLFPLGELTKAEVRRIAREKGLPVADKPESQEICFVPSGSYREFIQAYLAEQGIALERQAGEVVTTSGKVLGEHQGLHNYTVGQRKGLGVALGTPLYVVELDHARNRLIVGPDHELLRKRFVARDVNWIQPVAAGEIMEAAVKIRNKHVPALARIEARVNGRGRLEASVEFLESQRAITPGQAAVFYDGSEVLGGGWIAQVL